MLEYGSMNTNQNDCWGLKWHRDWWCKSCQTQNSPSMCNPMSVQFSLRVRVRVLTRTVSLLVVLSLLPYHTPYHVHPRLARTALER